MENNITAETMSEQNNDCEEEFSSLVVESEEETDAGLTQEAVHKLPLDTGVPESALPELSFVDNRGGNEPLQLGDPDRIRAEARREQ